MRRPGLDLDGFIEREGSLERVPSAFEPVVDMARSAIADAFGPEYLHSAYLYGSIPRGTAVPGVSDLDALLVLRGEPTQPTGSSRPAWKTRSTPSFRRSTGRESGSPARPQYSVTWNGTTWAGSSRACARP
jgi:hypothetical protein